MKKTSISPRDYITKYKKLFQVKKNLKKHLTFVAYALQ